MSAATGGAMCGTIPWIPSHDGAKGTAASGLSMPGPKPCLPTGSMANLQGFRPPQHGGKQAVLSQATGKLRCRYARGSLASTRR